MAQNEPGAARPQFYMEAVHNRAKSDEAGRPIYEDKEFVKIIIPGDRLMNFVSEVNDEMKARFPDEYAAFKRGEARSAIGTPLEMWPQMSRARAAELKHHNILTVEEFAAVQDGLLTKLGMHAREEREQARTFLAAAQGSAETSAMAARIAQLEQMVERLTTGAAPAPAPAPAPQNKAIEDCTDAELKEFIKAQTGQPVLGNPKRETLMQRAAELAEAQQAAA